MYFLHSLPDVQSLIAIGAGGVQQPFEQIVGSRVGKFGIVAERCLPVKIPRECLIFLLLVLGAQLFNFLLGV